MINKTLAFSVLILLIALVACAPQDDTLPTLAPLDVEPTTEIEITPTTIDTAIDADITPTDVQADNTSTTFSRPTLPPTWTPLPESTEPPTETPVIPTITPFFPANNTLPAGCDTFAIDDENTTIRFNIGDSPTVVWTAVDGASQYRVGLTDATGLIIKDDIFLTETSYTFSADLFELGKFYGWTVYPLDVQNIQMCNFRGSELIPVRPIGGG